jgi:hypothetical protein
LLLLSISEQALAAFRTPEHSSMHENSRIASRNFDGKKTRSIRQSSSTPIRAPHELLSAKKPEASADVCEIERVGEYARQAIAEIDIRHALAGLVVGLELAVHDVRCDHELKRRRRVRGDLDRLAAQIA